MKNKRVTLVLLVLLLTTAIVPTSLFTTVNASGESWLTGWTYRKSHEIEGSTEGAQTDYQIPIRVNYEGGEGGAFAENGEHDPLYFGNYPSAVYYNGKTYIGWQGDAGYDPYIISYDHATDAFSDAVKVGTNPLSGDSHGAPVILIDDSGYIHVFYGCHNSNLKYTKSDNPEDITAWTGQADPASGATYPVPIPVNGDIYLFYRYYDAGKDPRGYKLSENNGASWGGVNIIIEVDGAGDAIYTTMAELYGTKIHMVWRYYDSSAGQPYNVYHAYLELSDGHMYSMDGTDLGTSISTAEADASCLVVDSGAYDSRQMALHIDGDGYPYIICCIETATALDHRFIRWTGSAWTAPVTIAETDEALNAMDFIVHSSTSITAFLVGSGSAGRGGDIVKWSWNGATWTEVKTILSEAEAGTALQDPKVVVNYDDELQLVFTEYGGELVGDLKVYASDGTSLVGGGGGVDSGVNVYTNGKSKTDFGDIRFTSNDGSTELDYWMEKKVNSDYALFWVKVPSIPASPSSATIYMYYGKNDATSASTESREDFTTYTEVEEVDDIQKTAYHVDFIDIRNRTTYLYKDYGVDYFSDFAEHLNIKRVTHAPVGGATIRLILMANVVGGQKALRDATDPHFYSTIGGTDPKLTMYEWDTAGNGYFCVPELTDEVTLGTMYYLSLRKYGTALVLDTYTTAAKRLEGGDGDFGHQTLALHVDYSFRYNYVGNTYDDGLAWAGSSDMEDLFFRKYVDPEPAHGAWGSEETEEGITVPTVTTQSATGIGWDNGNYHATLNGTITDTGGENCDERGFDWGYSSGSYGYDWTEMGSFGIGAFNKYIFGLTGDIVYFRAKAHNSEGWGYGDEMSFPKPDPENNPPNAPTLNAPDADSRWDMWEYVSFTWTFSDPDSGDIQSAYQLQLDDSSDFSSPLINTGKVSSGASVYNGYIPNTIGLFYWRVKTWDDHDLDGDYSSGRTIITSRILVYDISSDDGRLDIGTSVTLTVHLHHEYDGADITTGSFTLMGLALTHQSAGDWTTTHSRSTPQSITFNSVSGSTGNIDDVNMNGKTTSVIWDLIHATATQISDPRVSINANVDIYFTLKYDYDETAVTDGTVTIEGEAANHLGSGVWRITTSESTTQSITYDEFTSSGNVYGITEVDAEGHSETAIWDRWKLTSFWASSYSPQTGTNVTLFAKGELEYDGHLPNGDDNLEIESIQFDWDWSQGRYEAIVSKDTPGAITYDDLTDVYENTHGIDVGTMSGLSVTVEWGNYTYQYEFYGLYNENGSRAGSVDLSVHLPSGTVIYPLDGNLTEGFNEQPELFSWSLEGGGTRFIFPYKVNESVYIFTPDATYSVYSFTIKDYTGKIGSSNAWLESIRSVNGTERMVERQLIWDTYNPVPLTLAQSQIYILQIRFADGSIHRFGYFVPGAEGTPTLYLYDIDFSDQAHIVAEHVTVEATRPTDTHIRVNYKDELDDTEEVFVEVCLLNGTQVWNDTGADDILQFNWHGADNETDYMVNVEITHGFYGEVTYTCWLTGAQADPEDPFDLTLFGDWPIEGAFAVFLIIGTACLFSRASGVIGIGVTVLMAAVLAGIGWIDISYSVLATTFTLVVLWGLSGGGK